MAGKEASALSPRSLIVTVFGLYARGESGDVLPVAGLVRLLASMGVDEQAVRAAVSRLKRRGMLTPVRRDGAAGYALTSDGATMLAEGDERIFRHRRATPSDGWVLCVYSIPESERAKRHLLRRNLTWLGFGQAAGGVWIAPATVTDGTRAMLQREGLSEYVSVFRSHYLGDTPAAEAVADWWDLPRLALMYEEFIGRFAALSSDGDAPARAAEPDDTDPLTVWVDAVTRWRRLPYLDPGLPAELLPTDWPGHRAARLFHDLETRFAATAARRARELLG